LHGYGQRDRQILGPPEVNAASTMTIVACQRYLCTSCGAVVMVVPRGIEPRRHYGRAAICLALALWALAGQPTPVVRTRVCAWPGRETTTSLRTLARWGAAATTLARNDPGLLGRNDPLI
jgi:hypothetical protein